MRRLRSKSKHRVRGHVTKGSYDLMEGSSLLYVTTLIVLVVIGIGVVEIMFLIYHMASRYHGCKRLGDV